MSKQIEKIIESDAVMYGVMQSVIQLIDKALKAGPVSVILTRPSKSREQEKKYHAIIGDIWNTGIAEDGTPICHKVSDTALLKAVLVGRFEYEMAQHGKPLRKPGRYAYDWERMMPVQERASTKEFLVAEASEFIEFLHAEGARYKTQWSPIVTRIYDEMRQAA